VTAAVTIDEFYALGARAECFLSRGRALEHVDAASGVLTLPRHGLAEDTPFRLRVVDEGVMPAPLVAGTLYYAKPVSGAEDQLRASATVGGSAITITDAGEGRVELVEQLQAKIEAALDHWTGIVDEETRAHAGPWSTYPRKLKWIVCALAAYDLLVTQGLVSPEFRESLDGWTQRWTRAWEMLRSPISSTEGEDATPGVAEMGAVGFSIDDDVAQVSPL
jgi:hypothetical protein